VQISLSKSWSECAIEKISALMCHEETSLDRAWQHFEKAAELGSNRAHFYMGHMYQNGLGRNKDDAKAMEHYKIIAARGFPSSFTRLAFMYLTGAGVKPNVVIAWRCLIKAAALGDAVAAFELGESFDSTCSTKPLVKKDDALAIYWYAKSVAMIGGNVNGYLEQAKQSEQRIHLLKQKTPSLNNPLAEELFQKAYDVVLHDQIQQAEKLNPLVKVLELPDSGFVLKASSPHWPCNDEQDPHSISEAQRELGRMYSIGQYVQKNVEEAQRYIGFALSRWLPKT
jgi:TPR repeat protein